MSVMKRIRTAQQTGRRMPKKVIAAFEVPVGDPELEELEALDNWRFSKRMPSRAAAVRELLKRGLAAEGFVAAESGSKSQDFGVTGETSKEGRDRG